MTRGKRNQLISAAGFIFTALFITILFPREARFRYEYQQGGPWQHKDLIAPFDFPILKTKKELDADARKIRQDQKLYYRLDTMISFDGRKKLDENIQTGFKKEQAWLYESGIIDDIAQNDLLLSSQLRKLKEKSHRIFDSIYAQGILEYGTELNNKPSDYIIYVFVDQSRYEQKFIGEFLSPEMALQKIKKNFPPEDSVAARIVVPALIKSLRQNILFDAITTTKIQEEELQNLPRAKGSVVKGQLVISKGEVINDEKFNLLESFRISYDKQRGNLLNFSAIIGGQFIFIITILSFLYFFLILFRPAIIRSALKTFSILTLVVLIVASTHFVARFRATLPLYVIPFTLLPILVRSFYDTRLALFAHITAVMLSAYFAPNNYEFMILQLGAGITSIFSFVNFRKRAQLFTTVFMIFLTYSILFSALTLMREGTLLNINPYMYLYFFISCFATLFAFPLIYIFEKVFRLFSDITLLELSDTNTALLKELSTKAPGTFQHSTQVANLAEAAIDEIGGNSLLVRTGALYHDIGKMVEPQYFIENQVAGVNAHDGLSFDESAKKIIQHVENGVDIARRHRLPPILIDFIRTHHGTMTVQFFYKNYLKTFPQAGEDKYKFSYHGPVPFTKEQAVLMMADSVEAASRSLHEPSPEKIDQLVEKVIDYQIEEKQFANSDITLRDISRIKQIFKQKLMSIYHIRVEYPE